MNTGTAPGSTVSDPADAGPARRAGAGLPLLVAVAAGSLVSLQARVNGELRTRLGDVVLAALISFGTGLIATLVVVALRPQARRALPRLRTVPFPVRLGGLGGAFLVAVGAAAAPQIGVALLTVGLVAGQVCGGLGVDRIGLGPGRRRAVTPARGLGAGLTLVAVGIGVLSDGARSARLLLLVLVVLAGLLISVQQALNGRVRTATESTEVATLLNFVVGTSALALGLAVHAALGGLDVSAWPGPERWYLYAGGPLGAIFVAVAAVIVRRLGVLRLGLAMVSGQLLGGLLLDLLLPLHAERVGVLTVLGVALTLLAVVVSGREDAR